MAERNWCWTLNNPTEEEILAIQDWEVKYLTYGKEVGESGTPHLQGYLETENTVRVSALKKLNKRVHWELRRGTQEQAVKYCLKEDPEPYEIGIKATQGRRNDIHEVAEMIKEGVSLKRVAQDHPGMWVKYYRGFTNLKMILIEPRNEVPEVVVYHGKTGCGKTRQAIEAFEGEDYWMWQPQCGT